MTVEPKKYPHVIVNTTQDVITVLQDEKIRPLHLSINNVADLSASFLVDFTNHISSIDTLDETSSNSNGTYILDDLSSLVANNGVLELLVDSDAYIIYGYALIHRIPTPDKMVSKVIDPKIFENAYYLSEFYVHPEYRKIGIGDALIKSICDRYKHISLHVREDNPAILLYRNNGFIFLDRIIDYYPDDVRHALSLLYKDE